MSAIQKSRLRLDDSASKLYWRLSFKISDDLAKFSDDSSVTKPIYFTRLSLP